MDTPAPQLTNGTASLPETKQAVYDFLQSHPIGALATVDLENNPHVTVVYFSVNEDFSVTFVTKEDTKKHSNLQHNNNAMLVCFEAVSQTTVQIAGEVTDISEEFEAQQAIKNTLDAAIKTSEENLPPIMKLDAGYFVTYKLVPSHIRMAVFSMSGPGGYKNTFETIKF
jgi:general stress protein 26